MRPRELIKAEECMHDVTLDMLTIRSDPYSAGKCPEHGNWYLHISGVIGSDGYRYDKRFTCKGIADVRVYRRPPRPRGHVRHHKRQLEEYTRRMKEARK